MTSLKGRRALFHACMHAWLHALRLVGFPHFQEELFLCAMCETKLAPRLFAEFRENLLRHSHLEGSQRRFLNCAGIGLDCVFGSVRRRRVPVPLLRFEGIVATMLPSFLATPLCGRSRLEQYWIPVLCATVTTFR